MMLGLQKGKMTLLLKNLMQYLMVLLTINQQPTQPKAFQYQIQIPLQLTLLKKLLIRVIKIYFFKIQLSKVCVYTEKSIENVIKKGYFLTKRQILQADNYKIKNN